MIKGTGRAGSCWYESGGSWGPGSVGESVPSPKRLFAPDLAGYLNDVFAHETQAVPAGAVLFCPKPDGGVTQMPTSEIESLAKGTQFSVAGTVEEDGYIYVVAVMDNEFAVLYRTNAQSRALEDALRREAIPYRLVGSVRFYDRREIRDLMAYLKLIANPADEEAFRRAISVPKRGIGDTTVDTLAARARELGVSLSEVASKDDLHESLRPAAKKALADFTRLIAALRERAKDTSVDVVLQELIASGTELTPVELKALRDLNFSACRRFARCLDPRLQKISFKKFIPRRNTK